MRKRHWTPMSTGSREPRNALEVIFATEFGHAEQEAEVAAVMNDDGDFEET